MQKPFETRVETLEHANKKDASRLSFADLLREARLRAHQGEHPQPTPITAEMMEGPVNGEFWRRIHKARARVRSSKQK